MKQIQIFKNRLFLWIIALAVILGTIYGVYLRQTTGITLHSNGQAYHLAVAKTESVQEKGLGDRESMPVNQGMLFIFDAPAVRCFWMKDMHFPLDIIWLNSAKQVVFIESKVSQNTYPQSFCPPELAKYVIELNAGQAATANIQIGQTLSF
jgi:hypothetical protein